MYNAQRQNMFSMILQSCQEDETFQGDITFNNKDKNINTDKKEKKTKSGQVRVPGIKGIRSSETVVRHTDTKGLKKRKKKKMGLKDCGRM